MRIEFKIKNDILALDKPKDTFSGNVNFYQCSFDILTNQELSWICVFKKGDEVYQQAIENGVCMIPQEVLLEKGKIQVGCYAVSGNEEIKRISTNWIPITISEGAYSQGSAPKIPEKDVWETLVLKNVPIIGENGNWYIYDTEKSAYVDSGRTSKGDKGDKGDTGIPGTTNAANALKGNVIGQNVIIDDISPIEHDLDIKLKSKNLVSTFVARNASATGIALSVTMSLEKGKTYVFSYNTENTGARMWYVKQSAYFKYIANAGTKTCDGTRHYVVFTALQDCTNKAFSILQATDTTPANTGLCSDIMIEEGETATDYTPYIKDVSDILVEVSDNIDMVQEAYSSANGTVENVISSYPSISVTTKNPDVILDVTYNKDINKAFSELEEKFTNAIISLGGNV